MTVESVLAYPAPATAVVCRNQTAGVLVIASDPRRTHEVNFGPVDASDGSDYQHMPPEIIRTPAFAKQIAIGTLTVVQGEDDPVVRAAMSRQSDAYWKRADEEKARSLSVLDEVADNDFVVVNCIGPGTRPDAPCGENIPRKSADVMNAPPLCDRHSALKDRCVRRGDGPWILEAA